MGTLTDTSSPERAGKACPPLWRINQKHGWILLWRFLYRCVCGLTHMQASMCVHVHMETREQPQVSFIRSHLPVFWDLSLAWNSSSIKEAGLSVWPAGLLLPSHHLGDHIQPYPFLMEVLELNSSLQGCKANTLSTDPSPLFLNKVFTKTVQIVQNQRDWDRWDKSLSIHQKLGTWKVSQ